MLCRHTLSCQGTHTHFLKLGGKKSKFIALFTGQVNDISGWSGVKNCVMGSNSLLVAQVIKLKRLDELILGTDASYAVDVIIKDGLHWILRQSGFHQDLTLGVHANRFPVKTANFKHLWRLFCHFCPICSFS